MQQIIFEGFELVSYNEDGTRTTHVAYTKDKKVAELWKGRSNWNGYSETRKVMNIIEVIGDIDELNRMKLIESARAKLTKAELAALGLK